MPNNPADQHASNDYWSSKSEYNYMGLFPERFKNQVLFATEWLLPRLKKTDRLLDLGCADGWFDFVLAGCVASIDAYDLSESLLQVARGFAAQIGVSNIHFRQADATTLVLTESYNHILCMAMFAYIFDNTTMSNMLSMLRGHLEDGGFLALKDTLTLNSEDYLFKENDYCTLYRTRDNYVALVEKAGFRLVGEDFLSRTAANNCCSKCFLFEKQM